MLLQWYVWMPIVAILSFLTWRNYQRADEFEPAESVLLILEIPKAKTWQIGRASCRERV